MTASILTSVIAYISTNIDDIFVLMILLAQTRRAGRLAAGHFLGVGAITAISMLGALGLQNLPLKYVGILGLVPIFLGVKAWRERNGEDDAPEQSGVDLLGMAAITLGNGADNIGVYIPLFTAFSPSERMTAVAVFALMTGLWLFLAGSLSRFPGVQHAVARYKHIAIPVVFIALGVYIILDSGLIG